MSTFLPLFLVAGMAGSAMAAASSPRAVETPEEAAYRDKDDLLTAGLGLEGLRGAIPAPADANAPTFSELRRRALWANWRGIADVAPGGGLGEVYGHLDPVPGREFHGVATVSGAKHAHRVLLQLPDQFDKARPCLLVTASSGSRGVYGAIALAGGWGLPRGCAVAYTDKGTGTDWARFGEDSVHIPHLHSGDNPEADWGRHVLQAAAFGRDVLLRETGIKAADLTIIAVGVSNGAGAVLRASGDEATVPGAPALNGVVAISPNIHVHGGTSLFEVTTQAAVHMPCALAAPVFDGDALLRPGGVIPPSYLAQCAALSERGLVTGEDAAAQAQSALQILQKAGWTDAALRAGALSVNFDLWRAVGAGYASAYLRTDALNMPFGYRYAARDALGKPSTATSSEAALWWSDTSGIPPGGGVALLDPPGENGRLDGLLALQALATDATATRLRDAIAATEAAPPRSTLPILLLHGVDDGLVPEFTSSAPFARWAKSQGAQLSYWRIHHAQHFDALLGLPGLSNRYLPLMPYAYAALDAMWAHLHEGAALPGDREITPVPRTVIEGAVTPLKTENLGL